MGPYADTEMGKAYRNGKQQIEVFKTDDYTKDFLQELQQNKDSPPIIDTTISISNVKKNYKI